MKILYVPNGLILATGDYVETDDLLTYPNLIVPKHVAEGYQIIDVELPEDFELSKYLYQNNSFVANPDFVQEH
jgi:hypothetical protein